MRKQGIITAEIKIRKAGIRNISWIETTLLDKVVQRRLRWFRHNYIEGMPVDRIPHTALHARFEEKDTKAEPDNAG